MDSHRHSVFKEKNVKEYVIHKRFKGRAICGEVNLPAKTPCYEENGFIYWQGNRLFAAVSENAHRFCARNDDGNGLRRGEMILRIQNLLARKDKNHQKRWNRIWTSPLCQPLKREDYGDYWLWGQAFYDAGIDTLESIWKLIGAGGKNVHG